MIQRSKQKQFDLKGFVCWPWTPVFLQIYKMKPNPGLHLRQTATMSVLFRDVASLPSVMVSISKRHITFQDLCKYTVLLPHPP